MWGQISHIQWVKHKRDFFPASLNQNDKWALTGDFTDIPQFFKVIIFHFILIIVNS